MAVIKSLYGINCSPPDTCESAAKFYARVYASADYYRLPFLKHEVRMRFRGHALSDWTGSKNAQDCLLAAQTVYTTTPEEDRGLRDVVVQVVNTHNQELFHQNRENQAIIKSIPELSYDLVCFRANPENISPECIVCQCPRRHCGTKFDLRTGTSIKRVGLERSKLCIVCPYCELEMTVEEFTAETKPFNGHLNGGPSGGWDDGDSMASGW